MATLLQILIFAIPVIFAITVHEVAHGWVAANLGDPTAKSLGRLTLNPIKHADPIGTVALPLMMVFLSMPPFGWAKPVPVDWRNLRQPRRDMAIVAAAGPLANLAMLLIWVLFLATLNSTGVTGSYFYLLSDMAIVGIKINTVLMVLNLFPLPPLDGSRIVTAFLSPAWAIRYSKLEPWGLMILVLLLFTGVLGAVLYPIMNILLSIIGNIL